MDIATASALNLYNYQAALKNLGPSASPTPAGGGASNPAVLQALTSAYSGTAAGVGGLLPGADSLSILAGSSSLSNLVSGIYAASAANGSTSFPVSGLSNSLAGVSGLGATTTSSLLSGIGSGGLDGFSPSALTPSTTLALTAYSNQQTGVPGQVTAAATAAAASIDPSSSASVQSAIAAAQSGSFSSTINLLG